ncbi:MAG: adenylyltransferase/cytidyltransferase family protein [Candidatus Kariarchaeaceae archaeon]
MISYDEYLILKQVLRKSILRMPFNKNDLHSFKSVNEAYDKLLREEFIYKIEGNTLLTEKGRNEVKVVLTGGVFDILHVGHVETLNSAQSLGGERSFLIVVLANDSTVMKSKNRNPINSATNRAAILSSLKAVDLAMIGYQSNDPLAIIKKTKPNIIALGNDQTHNKEKFLDMLQKNGMLEIEVVRLSVYLPGKSTRETIQFIQSQRKQNKD